MLTKLLFLYPYNPVTIEVETGKVVFANFLDLDFKSNEIRQ